MSKPEDKWDKNGDEPEPDKPDDKWDKNGDKPKPEPPTPEPPQPDGEILWVDPGDGPLEIKGREDLTVQGRGGLVTLTGGDEDLLWIHNCKRVTVRDLILRNGYRGCRITDSEEITLEDVTAEHCEQQGFLTVNVSGLRMTRCTAQQIRDEHACYLSENFEDCTLEYCEFRDTGGSCFQANAEGADHMGRNVRLVDCTVDSEFAVAVMGAEVTFEGGSITGRVNVDTVRGWEARVTLDDCPHEGSVNEFNGSTVETV